MLDLSDLSVSDINASMPASITPDALNAAFEAAETDMATLFQGQLCSMTTKDGDSICPLCAFRRRVKEVLIQQAGGR